MEMNKIAEIKNELQRTQLKRNPGYGVLSLAEVRRPQSVVQALYPSLTSL